MPEYRNRTPSVFSIVSHFAESSEILRCPYGRLAVRQLKLTACFKLDSALGERLHLGRLPAIDVSLDEWQLPADYRDHSNGRLEGAKQTLAKAASRLRARCDHDQRVTTGTSPLTDLIQHLSLEAGRLMEDFSPELALTLPAAQDDRACYLNRVRQAADDIAALAAAAEVLNRRGAEAG